MKLLKNEADFCGSEAGFSFLRKVGGFLIFEEDGARVGR